MNSVSAQEDAQHSLSVAQAQQNELKKRHEQAEEGVVNDYIAADPSVAVASEHRGKTKSSRSAQAESAGASKRAAGKKSRAPSQVSRNSEESRAMSGPGKGPSGKVNRQDAISVSSASFSQSGQAVSNGASQHASKRVSVGKAVVYQRRTGQKSVDSTSSKILQQTRHRSAATQPQKGGAPNKNESSKSLKSGSKKNPVASQRVSLGSGSQKVSISKVKSSAPLKSHDDGSGPSQAVRHKSQSASRHSIARSSEQHRNSSRQSKSVRNETAAAVRKSHKSTDSNKSNLLIVKPLDSVDSTMFNQKGAQQDDVDKSGLQEAGPTDLLTSDIKAQKEDQNLFVEATNSFRRALTTSKSRGKLLDVEPAGEVSKRRQTDQLPGGSEQTQSPSVCETQSKIANTVTAFHKSSDKPIDSSVVDESEAERHDRHRALLPPPNPLLPKSVKVKEKAPESSVKGIVFRKLKEFKQIEDQPEDQLADVIQPIKHERIRQEAPLSPQRERTGTMGSVAMSIEQSRLVRNVVYLRDVSILETLGKELEELTQKDVFQHENFIDVKHLIRQRDISERMTDQLETAFQRAKRQQQTKLNLAMASQVIPSGALDTRTGNFKLAGPEDRTLLFESRFETGNLYLASKVSEQEYDLLMQNDTNTAGHTQWFYFKVGNTRAGVPVKFNILNYNKPDSMFNYGMKVSVYSEKRAERGEAGWHRACSDISYFRNQVRKDFSCARFYHTLTFTYEFAHDHDTVFFAYCVPYSFSDLTNDIQRIESDKRRTPLMQRATLCKTLGGVNCEVLTITSASPASAKPTEQTDKQGVVISARVHPGETVGSWMMRGVLFFLTDPDNTEAAILREHFIFKVIPMLNPDGVINGNYRCSLAGCDLNRRWKFPSKQLQPTVYHTKRLIKKVHTERTCVLYCDLHGHSRKPNVFMYGCDVKGTPEETRLFPLLLSKISPLFDFSSSRFGVQKSKEATARVAVFKELKTCPLIYTMESTFSGLDKGPYSGMHVSTSMLESMGRDLCRALLVQCNLEVPAELKTMPTVKTMKTRGKTSKTFSAEPASDSEPAVQNQHALSIKQTLLAELKNNKELLKCGNGDSSSGSDSEPSEDNLEATELVKNLPAVDKPLSLALKQEQAAKKEQVKLRRQQERSVSPIKTGDQNRWRFSTTANLRNQGQDNDYDSPTRTGKKGRQTSIKLSEIKEVHCEEQSNASPLKAGREVQTRQPVKLAKVKTMDAVTQTERSDYFLMKQRALNKQGRLLASGKEGSVQLRIANIELHETAFGGGVRPVGMHNQAQLQQPSAVTTTISLQGPTVSDFNAIFAPGSVQVQARVFKQGAALNAAHHNRSKSKIKASMGANQGLEVTQSQFSRQLHTMSTPQPSYPSKPNQANEAQNLQNSLQLSQFKEYLDKNRQLQMKLHRKMQGQESQSVPVSHNSDRSQNQLIANSTQNDSTQKQSFQSQSRAPQRTERIQEEDEAPQPEVLVSRRQMDWSPYAQEENDRPQVRLVGKPNAQQASHPSRIVVNQNDYVANNFKKNKRFQVSSGSPSVKSAMQRQSSLRRQSEAPLNEFEDHRDLRVGPAEPIAPALAPSSQTRVHRAKQDQVHSLAQTANQAQFASTNGANGPATGSLLVNDDTKKGQLNKRGLQNQPLVDFLESQILYEKSNIEKGVLQSQNPTDPYYSSKYRTASQSGSSRTGGFVANQNPQQTNYQEELEQLQVSLSNEPNSESKHSNVIQLRPIISLAQKESLPILRCDPDSNQSPTRPSLAKSAIKAQYVANRIQSQSYHQRASLAHSQLAGPLKRTQQSNPVEIYQDNDSQSQPATTGKRRQGPTIYVQQKQFPAGVRNQVQQLNRSNLYTKVYGQQGVPSQAPPPNFHAKATSPQGKTQQSRGNSLFAEPSHYSDSQQLSLPMAKSKVKFASCSTTSKGHLKYAITAGTSPQQAFYQRDSEGMRHPLNEGRELHSAMDFTNHQKSLFNAPEAEFPASYQNQLPNLHKFSSQTDMTSQRGQQVGPVSTMGRSSVVHARRAVQATSNTPGPSVKKPLLPKQATHYEGLHNRIYPNQTAMDLSSASPQLQIRENSTFTSAFQAGGTKRKLSQQALGNSSIDPRHSIERALPFNEAQRVTGAHQLPNKVPFQKEGEYSQGVREQAQTYVPISRTHHRKKVSSTSQGAPTPIQATQQVRSTKLGSIKNSLTEMSSQFQSHQFANINQPRH